MLLGFAGLVVMDVIDEVVLPVDAARCPTIRISAFIANLVQHVIQVVDRIHDLSDIRFLKGSHSRDGQLFGLHPNVVAIRVAVNAIDVVSLIEGMAFPGKVLAAADAGVLRIDAPAIKQHDRHIYAAITRVDHSLAQTVKIALVELGQIELGFAIQGGAGAGALVGGHRIEPVVVVTGLGRPARLFPGPQAEEVVMVGLQEVEIGAVVEDGRRVRAAVILEVGPGMRPGQQDGPASPVHKVARVGASTRNGPAAWIDWVGAGSGLATRSLTNAKTKTDTINPMLTRDSIKRKYLAPLERTKGYCPITSLLTYSQILPTHCS